MNILIIGLNHKTADVHIRERLAFSGARLEEGLRGLRAIEGIEEAALLSTCNRVEIYAAATGPRDVEERVKEFLAAFHGIPRSDFEGGLYALYDEDAVRHIFRVASSLDSMVVGEPQILGQLKDVFDLALKNKSTGVLLNRLMKKAISTAKRVRTETKIAEHAVSISFSAVELAKKIFTTLEGKSFMLLGAGDMAELAARHLVSNGVKDVCVANRTFERGCELAQQFCGRAVRFEDIVNELGSIDILICSTGASTYVLSLPQMQKVMRERRHRPVFIIDISVPRNIDPDINRIENVYLYDIDDLQDVVNTNRSERVREAQKGEEIIDEEVQRFMGWMVSLNAVPLVVALREKAQDIRSEEFRKFRDKFRGLDEEQLKAIEYLTVAIMNKLIHPATIALKEDSEDREVLSAAIRRLYDINGNDS